MTQLPRGTRDFPPEEKILRDEIVGTLKGVFERYGFSPFETPMMERLEVLTAKYAGGAEILKETFSLQDQGKRRLGLRYDLTVPLARYIAMNPRIKLPFKRYHVGDVFRDGPVSHARYRQFTQCDVDTVGSNSRLADAELLAVAGRAFKELDLPCTVRVNNRKILNDLLDAVGIAQKQHEDVILSIDKLDKVGTQGVSKELQQENSLSREVAEKVLDLIAIKGSNAEKLAKLEQTIQSSKGLAEMKAILGHVQTLGTDVELDVSLARGLAYYTGMVMEVVLKDSKVKSSVCGGGRYDEMVGKMVGKGDIPAAGISFGLDRIYDAILEKKKQARKSVTQLLVVPIGTEKESFKIAERFRQAGINTDIDLKGRSPSKNLSYANAYTIPYVAFVGEDELKQNKVKLKNLESGEENVCTVEEAVKKSLNLSDKTPAGS